MRFLPSFAILLAISVPLHAADWPMWRYDANRSNVSPGELPPKLHLQWTAQYPQLLPAWPDQIKMQYDEAYEPIVVGSTMYFASSRWDAIIALDTRTGKERWRFHADGPIRFAPVAYEGLLLFTCDDGFLYCISAERGELVWKFRGGPSDRKILGNERLISAWPARGGPVVAEGHVYFAASIWPFMGIFIHSLDAKTGEVIWTNDGDGSVYMKQPHNADAFASVAPQGALVVSGKYLLLPGGRSVPACFDRKTGKMVRYLLAENNRRGGGSKVSAMGPYFFNGGAAFETATAKFAGDVPVIIVSTPKVAYTAEGGVVKALDLPSAAKNLPDPKAPIGIQLTTPKITKWPANELASVKTPAAKTMIKSGSRLYCAGSGQIFAVGVKDGGKQLELAWTLPIDDDILRLVAADDRLFAVAKDGQIYCFGGDEVSAVAENRLPLPQPMPPSPLALQARQIIDSTQQRAGYAVVWGAESSDFLEALATFSDLKIVAFSSNPKTVDLLRRQLVQGDLYGTRVAVLPGDPNTVAMPPYLASLVVVDPSIPTTPTLVAKMYATLRPFGGTLYSPRKISTVEAESWTKSGQLAQAEFRQRPMGTLLLRQGPLPGSANWTHENADPSNTRVSLDQLVKAPLGVLWFGGPTNESILPRHGHGPQPQVIDGRMIIEGTDLVRALDIYTGRLLWETPLPGVGQFYNNTSHQPGANSSGGNIVSTSDAIYVAYQRQCAVLDPTTGKILKRIKLPTFDDKTTPMWGYINVAGDYLIGGADPLFDAKNLPPKDASKNFGEGDEAKKKSDLLSKLLKSIKSFNDNYSSSKHLVVMNRHSGEVLWTRTADDGFRHNATCIGDGKLFTIDRLSGDQAERFTKEGKPLGKPELMAFDLRNGQKLWSTDVNVFGTWLSYSEKHDVLIEAGRVARDSLRDEPKGMRAYQAADGQVLWFEKNYAGPAMLHGDTILQGQGACDLLTGKLKMRADPITGQPVPWAWTRNYGCNTPAASTHLLTFRSGAAGYFDLCNDGGTGNFGGFRSSCTNNLIVAGGILTAPEYTRTCTCSYQNQSSIALYHLPEAEMWTYFGSKEVKGAIQRLGLNFGAAGDRRAESGTLWLEYPSVAGTSPGVQVTAQPTSLRYFRRHSARFSGPLNWVGSSGVFGIHSLTVQLGKGLPPQKYTVRMIFAEPDEVEVGERRFGISIQGQQAMKELDILRETGGRYRTLIREFHDVQAEDVLQVHLQAVAGDTLLSGLEIVLQKDR